jgi:hypothetical protein
MNTLVKAILAWKGHRCRHKWGESRQLTMDKGNVLYGWKLTCTKCGDIKVVKAR